MAKVRKRIWKTSKGETRTAGAVDFVDANGTRDRRQFGTRREADDFRVEIEGQLRAGTFRRDAAKVTMREAGEIFLEHCDGRQQRGERMTRHNLNVYRGHIRNYILHPEHGVGGLRLAQLGTRAVTDLRDRLRAAGVTVPTTRKVLATLHGLLQYAIGGDLIAVNAARGVKVIGRRDEGSRKIAPSSKEAMRRLLDAADEDFRVVLVFAAASGIRAGELHALRWRHVDLGTGEVTVETRGCLPPGRRDEDARRYAHRAARCLGGDGPQGLEAALDVHEARRSRFPEPARRIHGARQYGETQVCAPVRQAGRAAPRGPGRAPPPAPDRFNWHALRHFAVSCWIEAGLNPKTVQTFAGHSSLQVTMDQYGHLFKSDDHKRAMDDIANGLFA